MSPASPRANAPLVIDESSQLEGFLALRWVALLAGAVLVGVAGWRGESGDALVPMVTLITVALVSNAVATMRRPARAGSQRRLAGWLLALDTLALTGLLALSGGASNPFTAAFLYPVVLGALVLTPGPAWAITVLSTASYAGLFFLAEHHEARGAHGGGHAMGGHLVGMWVAFVLVGPFLTVSIGRIRRALREADARVREAEAARERSTRLAALATLATGAAHELSTPLGTIAVAAAELQHKVSDDTAADVALIRAQVSRCRDILGHLAADAGVDLWDGAVRSTPGDLVGLALEGVPAAADVELVGEDALWDDGIRVPERAVARALRGLLRNARQAAGPAGAVRVRGRREGDLLVLAVEDDGVGMPPEVRARATEPFFTTRGPGEGMGLGLFYARTVAEQLGGRLDLDSTPGRGTTVAVRLPLFRSEPA
jgi:two-component system sensor histidine kinase RegB